MKTGISVYEKEQVIRAGRVDREKQAEAAYKGKGQVDDLAQAAAQPKKAKHRGGREGVIEMVDLRGSGGTQIIVECAVVWGFEQT